MVGARMFGRGLAAFAAGAALSFVASRLMPPLAGRAIGAVRAAAGGDPFDALARDHQRVLGMIDTLLQADDGATMRRTATLLQIKRALTAHAFAEEDVVYPLLHDQADAAQAADRLYREHADLKLHLFRLEQLPKDDPRWRDELGALRDLIARHARDEEEIEFPRLRAALSPDATARLSSEVAREKQLVL